MLQLLSKCNPEFLCSFYLSSNTILGIELDAMQACNDMEMVPIREVFAPGPFRDLNLQGQYEA